MSNKKVLIIVLVLLLFWYWKKQKAIGMEWGGSGSGVFNALDNVWNWNNNTEVDPVTGEPVKPEDDSPTSFDLADPLKPDDVKPGDDSGSSTSDVTTDPVKPADPVKPSDPVKPPSKPSSVSDSKFSGRVNWKR